jgi:hypothetical protein
LPSTRHRKDTPPVSLENVNEAVVDVVVPAGPESIVGVAGGVGAGGSTVQRCTVGVLTSSPSDVTTLNACTPPVRFSYFTGLRHGSGFIASSWHM